MLSKKEKLEEELRFLKESFEIGVITKEEHERGVRRIESNLKALEKEKKTLADDIQIKERKQEELGSQEDSKKEFQLKLYKEEKAGIKIDDEIKKEEKPEKEIEKKGKEVEIYEQKKEEEPEKEKIKREEIEKEELNEAPAETKEDILIDTHEENQEAEKHEEIKHEEKKSKPEVEERIVEGEKTVFEEEKKSSKKILAYVAVLLIIALGSWYFLFLGKSDGVKIPVDNEAFNPPIEAEVLSITCSSDDDCTGEGKIGRCINPGTENAECEFIVDVEVKLLVVNSANCFNCQTDRVISILRNFYPNLDIENIELDSREGKDLVSNFNLDALPAYIFNSSFSEAHNFDKLSNAFNKLDNNFIMKKAVANANYYFKRAEIPNKLDFFVKEGQEASLTAENNLKEFLDVFEEKVDFKKHDANTPLVEELGINTFPGFLINNRIKFSGVQPPEIIKENFCQLNNFTECSLELSENLV